MDQLGYRRYRRHCLGYGPCWTGITRGDPSGVNAGQSSPCVTSTVGRSTVDSVLGHHGHTRFRSAVFVVAIFALIMYEKAEFERPNVSG